MNKIVASVDSEKDSDKSLGYKLITDNTVNCANCSKPLLNVIKVKDSDRKNYFIANCPYCGDKSYKMRVDGVVYSAAAENLVIIDIDTVSVDDIVFVNNIRVKK